MCLKIPAYCSILLHSIQVLTTRTCEQPIKKNLCDWFEVLFHKPALQYRTSLSAWTPEILI